MKSPLNNPAKRVQMNTATKMTIHNRKGVRGIGLIELLIAVGIIGGILLVVLQMGGNMRQDSTVRNENSLLNTIAENVRTLYGSSSNYSGLTQTVARNARIFPGSMDDGTAVFNTWNGSVDVAAATDTNGNNNRAFTVTWGDVPESACSKMATASTTAARVTIGGTVVTDGVGQVNPGQAASACAGNATSDIVYLFERP